ncbi:Rec domain [Halorhabdus sp. SVX81]|uniref:response regulator transcription factor n=1 Tax=Halorhabdus sp. SVX81 TaxID=2978283 RepID=UPI0023DBA455|nr:response regulator [Halorhabdus sp. SVX81]WEL17006.1 Rec domain [Halorhabdus sp. SVX81]
MDAPVSVLVVEDDPDLRCLHRLWLAEDYDVTAVADGESALEAAVETVDVVLLDRDLPGMDGDGVARRLNADGFQGLIAMVTGREPDPSIATLPIDEYVTKPVEAAELRAVVDRLAARQQVPPAVRTLFGSVTRRARLESSLGCRPADSDAFAELTRRIDDQWATVRRDTSRAQLASMAADCLPPVLSGDRPLEVAPPVEQ